MSTSSVSADDEWITPGATAYQPARRSLSVSAWQPEDMPAAIARPQTTEQVLDAVRRGRQQGLRITVRSGGHSLNATHLAAGALVLDLRNLRSFELDPDRRHAWVGPGLTVAEAARSLSAHALSFPVGHAPTVGLGGFLLAGGNGWNTPEWGHGCDRVVAVEMVTVDGRRLIADERHHPEILHAARGAGPMFPGIITRFRLRLIDRPPRLTRAVFQNRGARLRESGPALDEILHRAPDWTEEAIFWRPPTPGRDEELTLTLTSFRTEEQELHQDALDLLGSAWRCSGQMSGSLADLVGSLPRNEGEAIFGDHIWSDATLTETLALLPDHDVDFLPSSSILLTTAARRPRGGASPAGLYAPLGSLSISAYAHIPPGVDPGEARAWVRRSVGALEPAGPRRYVGEADLSGSAAVAQCYQDREYSLLLEAMERLDPERVMANPMHPAQAPISE